MGQDRRRLLSGIAALALGAGGAAAWGAVSSEPGRLKLDVSYHGWTGRGLEPWVAQLRVKAALWWPAITAALASPGFTPPQVIPLRFFGFSNDDRVAAVTNADGITVNAPYFLRHLQNPQSFGMIAHEMVHVAQAYPKDAGPKWLREGIADYVRYYGLMPDDPGRAFAPAEVSWSGGYAAAAGLLDYIEKAHPGAVRAINAAMRQGRDGQAALAEIAGTDPERLWRAYLSTHPYAATRAALRDQYLQYLPDELGLPPPGG